MALLKRQTTSMMTYDDQSPDIWNSYVGNWTHYVTQGFNNNTLTATLDPGDSLSFAFSGSQVWIYGGLLNSTNANGELISYPTADYRVDGSFAGSYTPWFDSNQLIYFQTPQMVDGTHTVNVTVRIANATNPFILDSIRVAVAVDGGILNSLGVPSSPTPTSSALPVSSTNSAPVGTIVGGTVGGISGLVILTTIVWYFLRRWSLGRRVARFLGVRGPRDIQDTVEDVEKPFDSTQDLSDPDKGPDDTTPARPGPDKRLDDTATTPGLLSAGFTQQGPQSVQPNRSSRQPSKQSVKQNVVSSSSSPDPSESRGEIPPSGTRT